MDKRTCGYQRRKEAMTKSTELMEPMLKRALAMGVRAKYLLMDSWFSVPSVISKLRSHIHKFIDALKVIIQMAMAVMHKSKSVSEKIVQTIMNAVMGAAIIFFGLDDNKLSLIPEA